MASIEWLGGADEVAQVAQKNVGSSTSGHTFIITLTNEKGTAVAVLTHVVDGVDAGNTTTVAAEIVAEFNALTDAQSTQITASNVASVLVLTADDPGVPFYVSYSGTGTWNNSGATNTANSGPNDWNTAANWSTGAVPGSDSVYLTANGTDSILYGLQQTGVTLAMLYAEQGHPQVGLIDTPLAIKVTSLKIGYVPADGNPKTSAQIFNLKLGNTATVGSIKSTNTQGQSGKPPVQIDVDNASSAFTIEGSSQVGIGTSTVGETSTVGTITVKDSARVFCGTGLTLTTLNPEGGTSILNAGVTTVGYGKGAVIIYGGGDVATLNVGGDVSWLSSGTVTNLYVTGSGVAHCYSGTITNAFVYGESAFVDADSGVALACTFSNGVACLQGAPSSHANFGDNVKVTPSAP